MFGRVLGFIKPLTFKFTYDTLQVVGVGLIKEKIVASEKQLAVIERTLSEARSKSDSLSADIQQEIQNLLSPYAGQLKELFSDGDISTNPSSLIKACFQIGDIIRRVIPEARWKKLHGEWVVYGPASMIKVGETVTVVSSKGPQDVEIGEIVETDGENVFAGPVEKEKGKKTKLDLNPLFEGLFTAKGEQRTSIWVAVPNGDTRLKLKIDRPRKGKHAGRIFVKDAAAYGQGQWYGTQNVGSTYAGECAEELSIILADRVAAMSAYGELVSRCGVCNLPLEDEESVRLGIGPDCRSRF